MALESGSEKVHRLGHVQRGPGLSKNTWGLQVRARMSHGDAVKCQSQAASNPSQHSRSKSPTRQKARRVPPPFGWHL